MNLSQENKEQQRIAAAQQAAIDELRRAHALHGRHYRDFVYVYPVISRRADGLSIGINLNIDQLCNFDCAYCQVDRREQKKPMPIDLTRLEAELRSLLDLYRTERWRNQPLFPDLPPEQQQLRDLSLSGDGEATMLSSFPSVLRLMLRLKNEYTSLDFKMVLITNGTGLGREDSSVALSSFVRGGGEVWVKLDTGTPDGYGRINRSNYPFFRLLEQIRRTIQKHPIKIQAMFCTVEGVSPSNREIDAWIDRIEEIDAAKRGNLSEVQIYSLARPSANLVCSSLERARLEEIAGRLRERLPEVDVRVY